MTEAQRRDRTKYTVFADYNGMTFPVARVGTIKAARTVATMECKRRNAGQALTMRIFKQLEHHRMNKHGEWV